MDKDRNLAKRIEISTEIRPPAKGSLLSGSGGKTTQQAPGRGTIRISMENESRVRPN
jgi:hypothetical protein